MKYIVEIKNGKYPLTYITENPTDALNCILERWNDLPTFDSTAALINVAKVANEGLTAETDLYSIKRADMVIPMITKEHNHNKY